MKLLQRILHWFPYVRRLDLERQELAALVVRRGREVGAIKNELHAAVEHCKRKQQAIELECERSLKLRFDNDILKQRIDVADNLVEYQKEVIKQISAELLEYRARIIPGAPEPAALPKPPAVAQFWWCSCPSKYPFHTVACSKCSRTRPASFTSSQS